MPYVTHSSMPKPKDSQIVKSLRKPHSPLVHKPDHDPGLTLGQCQSSGSSALAETRGIEQAGSPRQNIPRGQGGCFQNQGQQSPLQNSPLCSLLHVVAERDAFDTLFDHAPDKLNLVKKVDPPPHAPAPIATLHGTCVDSA